jgi:hypothetical protein
MPVCLKNVIFLSLSKINTLLVARRTRTRVIGGYDSTREEDKGISAYLFYISNFVSNVGEKKLIELLW